MKKDSSSKSSSDLRKKEVTEDSSNPSMINVLLTIIALLLVVVIVLQIVDISQDSSSSGSNSQINEINEKVTRLDTFFQNNIPEYESAPTQLDPTNFPTIEKPDISNRPIMGSSDAQIILVEYSDFECPFCGRFFQTTYPSLKQYVDSGVAAFVFKDFPLSFHQLAEPSAIASKCVFRELGDDKFFEYHDTVFANQQQLSVENLKQWALDVGMDESSYDSCIEDDSIKAQVQADFLEGQQLGVSGTPSVALNDKLIVGACPAQTFDQAIELELAGTPFYVEECQVITG